MAKPKLKGELSYSCEYSSSPMGIITRIANLAGAPQEHEDELQALLEKQAKINNQLEFNEEEELVPDESDEPAEKKSNKANKQGLTR